MADLPESGQSSGTWGDGLNEFLRTVVVNVQDYNADPTGVADSTSAIQNAINNVAAKRGVVFIPQGTYIVNAAIAVKSNIILRGAGAGSILKKKNQSGTFPVISNGGGAVNNAIIENLRIDGNKSQQTEVASGNEGINLASGATDNKIQNVWVENTMNTGINCGGARNNIVNCVIKNIGTSGGASSAKSGIVMASSALRANVSGNVLSGIREFGIYLKNGASYSVISGNRLNGCQSGGIYVQGSTYVVIEGNALESSTAWGILVGNSGGVSSDASTGCNISYNTITGTTGSPGHGIYLNQGSKHVVSGNISNSNSGTGINLTSIGSTNVTANIVIGNVVAKTISTGNIDKSNIIA